MLVSRSLRVRSTSFYCVDHTFLPQPSGGSPLSVPSEPIQDENNRIWTDWCCCLLVNLGQFHFCFLLFWCTCLRRSFQRHTKVEKKMQWACTDPSPIIFCHFSIQYPGACLFRYFKANRSYYIPLLINNSVCFVRDKNLKNHHIITTPPKNGYYYLILSTIHTFSIFTDSGFVSWLMC